MTLRIFRTESFSLTVDLALDPDAGAECAVRTVGRTLVLPDTLDVDTTGVRAFWNAGAFETLCGEHELQCRVTQGDERQTVFRSAFTVVDTGSLGYRPMGTSVAVEGVWTDLWTITDDVKLFDGDSVRLAFSGASDASTRREVSGTTVVATEITADEVRWAPGSLFGLTGRHAIQISIEAGVERHSTRAVMTIACGLFP